MKIREFVDYLKEIEREELNSSEMHLLNRILWKLKHCLNAKSERWFKREIGAIERVNREKLTRDIEEFLKKQEKEITELKEELKKDGIIK